MIAEQNTTVVQKLRVLGGSDALSLRLKIDRAFSTVDLKPSSLPASAIVFIRKLRDPAPGLLPCCGGALVPPEWPRAVARAVEELARRAARPAQGGVGLDTEAVLFMDRSELLACLAADWCDGSAITRWWWRSLFRSGDATTAVLREWLDSVDYAPPAFVVLAKRGLAGVFAAKLGEQNAAEALRHLVGRFGLAEVNSWLSSLPDRIPTSLSDGSASIDVSSGQRERRVTPREESEVRTRWAPEAFDPRLGLFARVLLAVSLTLERAPWVLRARGLAGRLLSSVAERSNFRSEIRQVDEPQLESLPPIQSRPPIGHTTPTSARPEPDATRHLIEIASRHGADSEHQRGNRARPANGSGVANPSERHNETPATPRAQGADNREGTTSKTPQQGSGIPSRASSTIGELPLNRSGISQPDTTVPIEMMFDTEFGGTFYLINAALALNLYGDFTTPLEPGIELSIWDFLLLMGRELVGDRIEADLIWSELTRLAGRSSPEELGQGFDPPAEWRLPAVWLDAFPEHAEWSLQISGDRIVVRHPAGFTVLDIWAEGIPEARAFGVVGSKGRPFTRKRESAKKQEEAGCAFGALLRALQLRELRRYPTVAGLRRRLDPGPIKEAGIERWIKWIAGYLRVRLARALAQENQGELARLLLARRARVEVTPAKLDVFLSLAELSVRVRLSGLDRNPGWVPAAGRAIAFHYE